MMKNLNLWSLASLALVVASSLLALTGCDGAVNNNPTLAGATHADGSTLSPGTPNNPQLPIPTTPANANTITLGVKYVALKLNASDTTAPSQAQVVTLLANMSQVWSQCDIAFTLEDFSTPLASDAGVAYNPANQSDLEYDRQVFDDNKHVLYVMTGTWNRSGNLGADGSNGFSTLPPSNPQGTVFEAWVATNTLLLSHETGHLIGALAHTSDTSNLMNHFVTNQTVSLTQSQCDAARTTIKQNNPQWIR